MTKSHAEIVKDVKDRIKALDAEKAETVDFLEKLTGKKRRGRPRKTAPVRKEKV